jgi:chemotaxis signal transduction protein
MQDLDSKYIRGVVKSEDLDVTIIDFERLLHAV